MSPPQQAYASLPPIPDVERAAGIVVEIQES